MRVAVSGVGGFVGAHLARELVTHGHTVIGLGKGPVPDEVAPLLEEYVDQDLSLAWPDTGADAVLHLAGLSAVGPSFADPQGYLEGNSAPMTRLGEMLLARGGGAAPRVVAVSTGAVYAPGRRLGEDAPTRVSSPYVVSKLLLETQCAYYRTRGLDVVVMRPFNHLGPGQQPGFLLPDLLRGVAAGALSVGDLDTRRDYTDVRDVVRAYRLAVEAPELGTPLLNVCSGTSVSGRELLALVVDSVGTSPEVSVDHTRMRPDDPPDISGDNALIDTALGWAPRIDLATTVSDAASALAGQG